MIGNFLKDYHKNDSNGLISSYIIIPLLKPGGITETKPRQVRFQDSRAKTLDRNEKKITTTTTTTTTTIIHLLQLILI